MVMLWDLLLLGMVANRRVLAFKKLLDHVREEKLIVG